MDSTTIDNAEGIHLVSGVYLLYSVVLDTHALTYETSSFEMALSVSVIFLHSFRTEWLQIDLTCFYTSKPYKNTKLQIPQC